MFELQSLSKSVIKSWYCNFDDIHSTDLKFFAAALIREIPPISIFSIIWSASFVFLTVSENGYRSTITRSISGISYLSASFLSDSESVFRIPPNIFGWRVLTLPFKIEG